MRTRPYAFLAAVLAFFAWTGGLQAEIVPAADYPFPIKNPRAATLLAATYHSETPYRISFLEVRADRRAVPLYENMNQLMLGVFGQPGPAPLIFVIPGAGGYGLSNLGLMLAEQLHAMGFHAVTVPNPVSWQYAMGVSESTVPGFFPADAPEYYDLLARVEEHLRAEEKLDINGQSLVGVSLGGLMVAFLLQEDRVRASLPGRGRRLVFHKAVAINPSVDIRHAIDVVDGMVISAARALSPAVRDGLPGTLIDALLVALNYPVTLDRIKWVSGQWNYTDTEMDWLIGRSFRIATTGAIFAGQQVRDLGILKTASSPSRKYARADEAKKFSFRDYMTRFVLPVLQRGPFAAWSVGELLDGASLFALEDMLRSDARAWVILNRDDMLTRERDIEILHRWMGQRLYVYPWGGHVGNLWFEKNRADLRRIMLSTP